MNKKWENPCFSVEIHKQALHKWPVLFFLPLFYWGESIFF